MNIRTSVRVVKTKPESAQEIDSLTSGDHDFAWTEDIDAHVLLSGNEHQAGTTRFRTLSLTGLPHNYSKYLNEATRNALIADGLDSKNLEANKLKAKDLTKAYISLTANSASLVRQYFPEAMNQPIQSLEFIVASYSAIDAWSDNTRTNNVRASMATGKAIVEAIDVFAPFFPSLKQIQPISTIAGVALKTAESAYLVYLTHQQ